MKIESPLRVRHEYTQRLRGTPKEILPALCPVREVDWVDGWDPLVVYSTSGVAEQDCVFVTESENKKTFWFVTIHDKEENFVEMVNITPGYMAKRLQISLKESDEITLAEVVYVITSLGPLGDNYIANMTDVAYAEWMSEWERDLNAYLDRLRQSFATR